jgi:predicted Rossmann-fold nucleotide-binding protein
MFSARPRHEVMRPRVYSSCSSEHSPLSGFAVKVIGARAMHHPMPFIPIRSDLYMPQELMGTLDPGDYRSFQHTLDFKCFAYYKQHGSAAPNDALTSIFEALHDNSITQATLALLKSRPKVAAIMRGHDETRGTDVYRAVAHIAAALSDKRFLVASGGGPGAMEAAHLGARFANNPEGLDAAIEKLRVVDASLPSDASKVIDKDGTVNEEIVKALHKWVMPAWELSQTAAGESLALPTWYYGHEPSTPFATHMAKYFQNSIREDGLITLAAHGIVFASGKAGTLQEIFQDSVRNYYRDASVPLSPMVFLGKTYWGETLPAASLLKALFKNAKREQEFTDNVLVTDEEDAAIDFIVSKAPPDHAHLERLRSLGMIA